MKLLFPTRLLIILICISIIFTSCEKQDKCPETMSVIIEQNGPVYAGWPLYLKADVQSMAYLYKWTGPNGWKQEYQYFASDAYQQQRLNMTAADAGDYKLQLLTSEGCIAYEGSTTVKVLTAPTIPCTVPANKSLSSVVGVGDYNFIYRTFSSSSSYYIVSGMEIVPGGHFMRFAFVGENPPLPGVYKTSGYFGRDPDQVGLYIETGTYQFTANPDQLVYVNKVNNKLEVTFCSLKFNNPLNQANPITISAKIVQP